MVLLRKANDEDGDGDKCVGRGGDGGQFLGDWGGDIGLFRGVNL